MPQIGEAAVGKVIAHTFFDKVVTASENSDSFNCEAFSECTLVVYVSATGGTIPTMVPEIEISGDDSVWTHRYTITDTDTPGVLTRLTVPTVEGKITVTGTYNGQVVGNLGKYCRVGLTLGGTTPSFTTKIVGYYK